MIHPQPKLNPSHARRRARRAALQALYQWLLSGHNLREIEKQFREEQDLRKVDIEYFQELLHQIPKHVDELQRLLEPLLDRPINELDPVESATLYIGLYELRYRLDIPYRVIINESVDLAKRFGASDSYKYVNGVLDQLAKQLRAMEFGAVR